MMMHQNASIRRIVCGFSACLFLFLMSTGAAHARKVGGVDTPETLDLVGQSLTLNGAGLRKKSIIKLYVGALYLSAASSDASAIMSADEPMAIRLYIRSGFLSQKKMEAALIKGFNQSTDGNTAPVQAEIDQLIGMMKEKINKKDVYVLGYDPATGTHVSKNGAEVGVVEGLAFKQALFGIWLSDKPVQGNLKKAMLGQ